MASACAQSVLGFGAHIDRRPTIFVPELPSGKVCSLCDLFSAASFRLPCRHVLCEACYRHNSQIGSHCPLDKQAFTQEEVVPSIIRKNAILKHWIRCWNAGNGCDAEGFIGVMMDHFVQDCMFHTVNCRTCGEKMLHRELPSHTASGCATACSPEKSGSFLDAKEMLEKMSRENASLQRELVSLETRAAYDMKKVTDYLSATVYRMKADAGQIKCATCGPHIDSWIRAIGSVVCTNENTFMTALQRKSRHGAQPSSDAAHAAAENRAEDAASAVPASLESSGPTYIGTNCVNPIQTQTAESPNVLGRKPLLMNPLPSLLEPHESNLSEIQECCECIIENWTLFSRDLAAADIRNGRCECGMSIYGYGFLLVPTIGITAETAGLNFTVFAYKGLFGTSHNVPIDSVLRIRLRSRADTAKDLSVREDLSWKKVDVPQKVMGVDVLYVSTGAQTLHVGVVEARGFVSDDKVQLRFSVRRW
ncbi:hypothetical protein MTO96_000385 [Rhipicephalus appendiculatus]